MKTFTTLMIALLAAVPYVAAHGFVSQIKIDGKSYKGNRPASSGMASPIRAISSQNPNHHANNPALTCGPDAKKGSQVAAANPGSKLEFHWNAADMSRWPHNTGPVLTYLAECTGTTCDKFDASKAKWFKIDELGKRSNGDWAQQDLYEGKPLTVSLPSNLKAGNYLVRHEIIALHLASTIGGAEFYPSCTQLKVGGDGTGVPSANELVSIPGAYKDTDPGIHISNPYGTGKYTMPGPAVAKLVAGTPGNNSGDDNNDDDTQNDDGDSKPAPTTTDASSAPTPSPTKAQNNTSGHCKRAMQKKKRASFVDDEIIADSDIIEEKREPGALEAGYGRRHFSRVMGRFASHAASI
ncbi:hypothetical protein EIP91_010087 [Steccherinum ochraceum]|uniref:lytic cellulose monooxygenase (C4-dehydrogenating) n=1 Tax=Steccherinum ochraceum TaxID=92696 RepID=A0A4R0RRF3_9APHY|nr:hypothetical protein EIP91_010087 [Steccherinum ochraceum]